MAIENRALGWRRFDSWKPQTKQKLPRSYFPLISHFAHFE